VVSLRQSTQVWVREGQVSHGASSLVDAAGERSANIVVSNCDLLGADQPVTFAAGASPSSVTLANNISRKDTRGMR